MLDGDVRWGWRTELGLDKWGGEGVGVRSWGWRGRVGICVERWGRVGVTR